MSAARDRAELWRGADNNNGRRTMTAGGGISGGGNSGAYHDDLEFGGESDSFIGGGVQMRKEEQDEHLGFLQEHISKVKSFSHEISNTLTQQKEDLSSMSNDLETSQASMDKVNKRAEKLINDSGGPKTFCAIVGLGTIAFVLFMMVIYT